jgi:hypothetical protein
MRNSFNVLVLGKIRSADQMREEIARFLEWRERGFVDRIVFSGWEEDLSEHSDLFQELIEKEVEVVLTHEPSMTVFGHAFHQIKNLSYGISKFNDDDIVLKTRTDRVNLNYEPKSIFDRFCSASPPTDSPMKSRIMVQYCTPLQPYFLGDQTFMGLAGDIRKFVSADLWFAMEGAFLNPEQLLHSRPFLKRRPEMRNFFRVNPGLIAGNLDLSASLYSKMLESDYYCGALYWQIKDIVGSYILGFSDETEFVDSWRPGWVLEDLLREEAFGSFGGINIFHLAGIFDTSSSTIVEALLHAPVRRGSSRSLFDGAKSGSWENGGVSASIKFPDLPEDALDLMKRLWAWHTQNKISLRTPHPPIASRSLTVYHGREHMIK